MGTVRKLNVNKKTNNFKKRLKVVATTSALILVGTLSFFGIKDAVAAYEIKDEKAISAHYGVDSVEFKILDYIDISKILSELKLGEYITDNSLYETRNISNELKSPNELRSLIDTFLKEKDFINEKEVDILDDYVNVVLTLKRQETLVNAYIYSSGYEVANSNVTEATKKYAGEVFGIEDYNNITFNYRANSNSGEQFVTINNQDGKYTLRDSFPSKEEKAITNGVLSMIDTNTEYDKNYTDNSIYNKDRNEYIIDALATSTKLEHEVEENDLYSEYLARKLR